MRFVVNSPVSIRDRPAQCAAGRPAELLEQRAQRVELLAEAGPIPGLQPLESPIVVRERLPAPVHPLGPEGEGPAPVGKPAIGAVSLNKAASAAGSVSSITTRSP